MRYLLVDHITELERGVRIQAVKNLAMTEEFLSFHFPENPVMPGSLLREALVQMAGWLEAESSGFRSWVLLGRVGKCRYYRLVRPGDQVMLDLSLVPGADPLIRTCKGMGRVHGRKVIQAEFEGRVRPLPRLLDPALAEKQFNILTRAGGSGADG